MKFIDPKATQAFADRGIALGAVPERDFAWGHDPYGIHEPSRKSVEVRIYESNYMGKVVHRETVDDLHYEDAPKVAQEILEKFRARHYETQAKEAGYTVHPSNDATQGWAFCIDGDYSKEFTTEALAWAGAYKAMTEQIQVKLNETLEALNKIGISECCNIADELDSHWYHHVCESDMPNSQFIKELAQKLQDVADIDLKAYLPKMRQQG